jgi:hypothetical protein
MTGSSPDLQYPDNQLPHAILMIMHHGFNKCNFLLQDIIEIKHIAETQQGRVVIDYLLRLANY